MSVRYERGSKSKQTGNRSSWIYEVLWSLISNSSPNPFIASRTRSLHLHAAAVCKEPILHSYRHKSFSEPHSTPILHKRTHSHAQKKESRAERKDSNETLITFPIPLSPASNPFCSCASSSPRGTHHPQTRSCRNHNRHRDHVHNHDPGECICPCSDRDSYHGCLRPATLSGSD
jgi:hypothetical protein